MSALGTGAPKPTSADRSLLRRAAAVIAIQTALAVTLVIAAIVALVYSLSEQERHDATVHKLQAKTAVMLADLGEADDPAGSPGQQQVAVDALPDTSACAAVETADDAAWAADLPVGESELALCDTPALAYVAEQGDLRAVAVTGVVEQREETARLARLSILAGAAGVLAAAILGWVVARRAVRPLGLALATQRRFVADASHELRTPLAILHTRAQLLQRETSRDGPGRAEIDQLVEDARVLGDIVNDLLLSAERQHHPDSGHPVDLADVAADIVRSFSGTADAAGVDLVVDGDPDGQYVVMGAPSALRRAIAALVDNALSHVADSGRVTIGLAASPSAVWVRVVDDGVGFAPDLASELTGRFRRGPETVATATSPRTRLGLGLALVEEVVRAHDGTFEIASEPGHGACVTLTFPAPR